MKKLLLILLLVSAAGAHAAPAPTLIPFQGRLTDQTGAGYTNGQFTLIFNLYDQAVGGNVLWTETHQKVGVVNGMVNVFLGSINPTLASVDFSQTRHLGITIDADNNPLTPDPEMVPRQMIIPAFAAKQAENSTLLAGRDWSSLLTTGNDPAASTLKSTKIAPASLTGNQLTDNTVTAAKIAPRTLTAAQVATGTLTTNELAAAVLDLLVPPGSIMAFGGDTNRIPAGWLLCDGMAMSSAAYPRLFNAISTNWGSGYTYVAGVGWGITNATQNFNLPDLRGYFLRGVDGQAGRDPERDTRSVLGYAGNAGNKVGSAQGDMFRAHRHTLNGSNYDVDGDGVVWTTHTGVDQGRPGGVNLAGGSETRPVNAYVHYLIKY